MEGLTEKGMEFVPQAEPVSLKSIMVILRTMLQP